MTATTPRRSFLTGSLATLAAPALVPAASLEYVPRGLIKPHIMDVYAGYDHSYDSFRYFTGRYPIWSPRE